MELLISPPSATCWRRPSPGGAVRLLRVPQGSRGTYMCMLIFSNCGFIGFPVVQAIFGHQAVFYNAVVNIPF